MTLQDTLEAISLLLNTDSCSRVSGTAVYRMWGKRELHELTGPPKNIQTVEFVVDHELGTWSETVAGRREGRRYSKDTGQEYLDGAGNLIDDQPQISNWPLLIKMLNPTKFDIWGRPGDSWRMTGAESTEHGYLLHFGRDTSPATAELFIDAAHFSLPIRWSEIHPLGPSSAGKREIEITAIHVPDTWKRRMGIDMSEQGEDGAFVAGQ
ncbi:hypothetical protein [Williamsia sp. D3]|uniref:hypothetical protein n=1 Tax=Williamsia sp. D3 TaxID=1313067 RepID=UPI001268CC7D|nr:hypothetical protein [Williamsia sp. D3]